MGGKSLEANEAVKKQKETNQSGESTTDEEADRQTDRQTNKQTNN
jgi:hypothetical protein